MVDSTYFTVLLASSGGWLWNMAAGSSSDGVISSVEDGLAYYNWVVDVLFMVETPDTSSIFFSMASILDITKALVYNCLDVGCFPCTSWKGAGG